VRFHFKIKIITAFKRTATGFFQPFLQAIHAKAVFTLVAFHWVDQDAMADGALDVLC